MAWLFYRMPYWWRREKDKKRVKTLVERKWKALKLKLRSIAATSCWRLRGGKLRGLIWGRWWRGRRGLRKRKKAILLYRNSTNSNKNKSFYLKRGTFKGYIYNVSLRIRWIIHILIFNERRKWNKFLRLKFQQVRWRNILGENISLRSKK